MSDIPLKTNRMRKFILITIVTGLISCKDSANTIQSLENIQYIKSWMIEDLNTGAIDSAYAEYYLTSLNETENLLIKEINK